MDAELLLIRALHKFKFLRAGDALLAARLGRAERRRHRAMVGFYSAFVRPGDLCFDVGANLGDRTSIFLELGARVIAVEPQSRCLDFLRDRFGDDPRVTVVPKAVGSDEGRARLLISDAPTLSSMSPEWVERVRSSGRFSDHRWEDEETVDVTTLDALIGEFGSPAFCKIDVEGYEPAVLGGLNRPLQCLSFEFTPEYAAAAIECVRRLDGIGPSRFNYSLEETMKLALGDWVAAPEMVTRLEALREGTSFGDVYARSTA